MASSFVPRTTFAVSSSITRSYFLGHHAGALSSMRNMLNNVGLIIECRDSRVPLTSMNPLLESSLSGRDRIIVYTKSDLCAPTSANRWLQKHHRNLTDLHEATSPPGTQVVFTADSQDKTLARLMAAIRERAIAADSLTGMRAFVVGMPNAGKSTLLNALRRVGMNSGKAARTGAQPGVTRKLSTPVRIMAADDAAGLGEGVFLVDTPGVFIPYVADPEAMLRLSLVGCVKDGLVPAEVIADYLLYRLNLRDPTIYSNLCPEPTNDISQFLEAVGLRTGKLVRGGVPSPEHAAEWLVQQWRKGNLGRFTLDDVSDEALEAVRRKTLLGNSGDEGDGPISMNQARKRQKEARKARNAAKRAAADSGS